MRATLGSKAKVTGSVRPIPMQALDLILGELGARKPAAELKWTPTDAAQVRTILAKLPQRLTTFLREYA